MTKSLLNGFDKPWLLAFVQALEVLLQAQELANQMSGADDQATLVFDEQKEFSGRVAQLVGEARGLDPKYDILLGAVEFADSRDRPGLQMADLLAYETRRCLTEVILGSKSPREQWLQLQRARMPGGQPRIWPFWWDRQILTFVERLTADQA